MKKFAIGPLPEPEAPPLAVTLEQSGPSVELRVNGYLVLTLNSLLEKVKFNTLPQATLYSLGLGCKLRANASTGFTVDHD